MEIIKEQFETLKNYEEYISEDVLNQINTMLLNYTDDHYDEIMDKIMEAYQEIHESSESEEYGETDSDDDTENTKEVKKELIDASNNMPEFFYGNYALHIDLFYNEHKLETLLDTGAMINILYEDVAEKLGIMDKVFREKTSIRGIGNVAIECIGFVPKLVLKIGEKDFVLGNVKILKRDKKVDTDMIIGLSTMFYYGAVLDLKNRNIRFNEDEIPLKLYDASISPN